MAIRVASESQDELRVRQSVSIFPQIVRLRPAPHCRTPVQSYSLNVTPDPHFLNWQQDPHGNYLARWCSPRSAARWSSKSIWWPN